MKIQVVSDLHLEFFQSSKTYRFKPGSFVEPTDADVLVLAGDIIGSFNEISARWFTDVCNHFPNVLYLLGNHEFYGKDFILTKNIAAPMFVKAVNERTGKNNLHLMENSIFHFEDCIIAAGTLWTDFNHENPMEMLKIQNGMSDYQLIKNGERKLIPNDLLSDFRETSAFFGAVLDHPSSYDKTVVIVSHHLPSLQSTIKYPDRYLDFAFASNLDNEVAKADIWIHGHTHESYQYQIGGCDVHCNPRGYVREENPEYSSDYIIEVI